MELDEIIEMQSLSDANKERVRILSEAFEQLENAELFHGNKMAAYRFLARELSAKLPAISRKQNAISVSSVMRLYADYKKRGWKALVVNYARKTDIVSLPGAFVRHWQEVYLEFQVDQSGRQARAALLARLEAWRAGDAGSAIPGFAEPPPNQKGRDYPAGWSIANLMRHKPNTLIVNLVKKGRGEAKAQNGPLVRRTRRDLEPGALIIFDDVWQDHKVMFPGSNTLVRPLGLVALDAASGKQIAWGLRPRLRVDDGGNKSVGLKAFDMEMLITDVLCRIGTHREGVVFAMERGTANVSAKTEAFLQKFGITVERGGVDRAASFFGGIPGAFKGNSRFKAALESHHNLIHNALSFLPAYTGKDRTEPEHTQGMSLAYNALMRRAEKEGLPEDVRNRLGTGAVDWMTFFEIYGEIVRRVNARTEHDLEGWEKRIITEIRFAENAPWMPLDPALIGEEAAEALCRNASTHRVRKMSPDEVWAAGAAKLRRIKFSAFGEIFCQADGADARMLKRVSARHEFEIPANADDPLAYTFSSEILTPDGRRCILEAGEQYKVLLNPFSGAEELCVYEPDGRYLGSSFARRVRVPYNDSEALLPSLGQAAKEFAKLAHPGNLLARARQDEIRDAAQKNALMLAKFKADQEERARLREADRVRALERDDLAITQLPDNPPALPPPEEPEDDFSTPTF